MITILSIYLHLICIIVHRIIVEQKTRVHHISSQCTHRKKNETYRIEKKMNQSIYF